MAETVTIAGVEAGVIAALEAEGLNAGQIRDLFTGRAGSSDRHFLYARGDVRALRPTMRHEASVRAGWRCVEAVSLQAERDRAEGRVN